MVAFLLISLGVNASPLDEAKCPSGMVLLSGAGDIGMRGQPYGIVHTAHLESVVAPEKGCDAAVKGTPGSSACWVQTDLVDPVLPVRRMEMESFCMEAFPFPGQGSTYAKDGLNVWTAQKMQSLFRTGRFGKRRLCTASEFQFAVAGPVANRRFIYGDVYTAGRCAGDVIGDDLHCKNPETGVYEYGAVHSHWTTADAEFVEFACASTGCNAAGNRKLVPGMLVVMGGTGRSQTRQAPLTPHTWHDHGEATQDACGFHGWDDQLAVCADPGSDTVAEAKAWGHFVDTVNTTGSLTSALSDAHGAPVCPGHGR